LENRKDEDDKMSREMWEVMEAEAGETRMAEAEEREKEKR